MPKFLIEVPHPPTKEECLAAVEIFLNTGSHFLSQADWGCLDGVHKSWIMVDLESKDEARNILPARYRSQAVITCLTKFAIDENSAIVAQHALAH
jgi:hypothetical protein